MRANTRVPQALALSIIALLVLSILPLTATATTPNAADGTWTGDLTQTSCSNCSSEGNYIHLNRTAGALHDFADTSTHTASSYSSLYPFFFSPTRHPGIPADEYDIIALKKTREDNNQYYTSTTTALRPYSVQLFRFKLSVSGDDTKTVGVHWLGKILNASTVEIRYWQPYAHLPFGHWVQSVSHNASTAEFWLNTSINGSLTVGTDQYLNIAVVLHGSMGTIGTLMTDYLNVNVTGEAGYEIRNNAYAISERVNLTGNDPYWEMVTWNGFQTDKSPLKIQVLNANNTLIDDSELPGNSKGFTTPPVYLSSIESTNTIRLKALLSTTTSTKSPELYSWSVTWQRNQGRWDDRFSTTLRVSSKTYLTFNNSVKLTPIEGEWPLLNQNPANTRTAEGRGPRDRTLYWFSALQEGSSTLSSPVLYGDSMYITNTTGDSGSVYQYSPITVDEQGQGFPKENVTAFTSYGNVYSVVSPAVTDQYLIVPTGTLGASNSIYFFNKDGTAAINYSAAGCYWASPIVVGNTLYITSWSGDLSDMNTGAQLLAVNFSTSNPRVSSVGLPSWSFSTPAYSNGTVVVGCHNKTGASVFAYKTGSNLTYAWSAAVGAVDRASIVIADNIVFVVSELNETSVLSDQVQVTALNLTNGAFIWHAMVGDKIAKQLQFDPYNTIADTTPAYADGILYLTSPDGKLIALNGKSGTAKWENPISIYTYRRLLKDPLLKTSPAIANGIVYTGNPAGNMSAFEIPNGTRLWGRQTHDNTPVLGSPVVSNGLVYYESANGWIYSFGSFIASNESLNGTLISMPIKLPTKYMWNQFFVRQNTSAKNNSITYSLLDQNGTFLRTLTNRTSLLKNSTLPRIVKLKADFTAINIDHTPTLYNWTLTFTQPDNDKPYFINASLDPAVPNHGYLNRVIPVFTVDVKDNTSGLRVSAGTWRLTYATNTSAMINVTHKANITGTDGTNATQEFTADFTVLPDFNNITQLLGFEFNITDMSGNQRTFFRYFNLDLYKPTSKIVGTYKKIYTSPVRVNATASDNLSGVQSITLDYRYSSSGTFSGAWTPYSTINKSAASWTLTNLPSGGYYQLTTQATDRAGNIENIQTGPYLNFTFDDTAPTAPTFQDIYWFHDLPSFSIPFTDDFRLNTIQYRPNFDTDWITIAQHVNQSSYTAHWNLSQDDWDRMQNNQTYYLYFRVNDTLGNTLTLTDPTKALKLSRDTDKPTIIIEAPTNETFHNTNEHFNITARASDLGSGIESVELLYRYSPDNINWTGEWVQYGENLTSPPYTWDFGPGEGEGYYQFQIVAVDHAGNKAESGVISAGIQTFPIEWLAILGVLVAILVIISIVLLVRLRKR